MSVANISGVINLMKDISSIKYGYSVNPNIYTIDSSNKLTKLNPSSLMSTMYSSNMSMSISSFSSVFNQMTDDIDKLNSQYDIVTQMIFELGMYSKYNNIANKMRKVLKLFIPNIEIDMANHIISVDGTIITDEI